MRRWPLFALVGWTVFVWAGRIRNGGSVLLAVAFLALAAIALWRRGNWTTALAGFTVLVWAIRTPVILLHDHSVGFKVVHTVLATISIVLAVSAQRDVQRERQATTATARL
jgi:hypothetical protein